MISFGERGVIEIDDNQIKINTLHFVSYENDATTIIYPDRNGVATVIIENNKVSFNYYFGAKMGELANDSYSLRGIEEYPFDRRKGDKNER